MKPLAPLGPWLRRHPLALAMGASLALHGVALAATHYLWQGTAPAPISARTVAMVMIERAAPTPNVHDTPARPAPGIRPDPMVDPQPKSKESGATSLHSPKPAAPRASEERHATVPPMIAPPPRRPPEPTNSGSEVTPDSRPATATESGPKAHAETAAVPPAPPVASERSVPTSAGNLAVVHPQEGVSPPRYGGAGLANPRPRYPWLSRQRGEEGRVVLRVGVDEGGRAVDVAIAVTSGHGRLDRAAATAVRRWRFEPARRAGRAVAGTVDVPVTFRLKDQRW